jgi:hypothetical protein
MKLYYPESVLADPSHLPRTAEYCRIALIVAHKDYSLDRNSVAESGSVIEIDVPDANFDIIEELTTPKNRERQYSFYENIVIEDFIRKMSNDDISKVMEDAGVEYERPATSRFGI